MSKKTEIEYIIYTDGSCLGNPGVGGYAALVIKADLDEDYYTVKGFELETTNNKMELTAIIEAILSLPKNENGYNIVINSDSEYCVKGINEWLSNWKNKNWRGANRKPIKNKELWQKFLEVSDKHQIRANHIKAHSNNKCNELVDSIAYESALEASKNVL